MDKMVDHVFVFEGAGKIKDILGNYTEYRKQLTEDKRSAKAEQKSEPVKVAQPVVQAEKKKLSFKEKQEFEQLEKDLERLEEEKLAYTAILSDGTSTNEAIMDAGTKLAEIVAKIDTATERWMELAEYV